MSKKKRPAGNSKEGKSPQTRIDSAHSNNSKANAGQTLLAALAKKTVSSDSEASSNSTTDRDTQKKFGLFTSESAEEPTDQGQVKSQDQAEQQNETVQDETEQDETEQDETVQDESVLEKNTTTELDQKSDESSHDSLSRDEVESLVSKPIIRVDQAVDTTHSHAVNAPHDPASVSAPWTRPVPTDQTINEDENDSIDVPADSDAEENNEFERNEIESNEVATGNEETVDEETGNEETGNEETGNEEDGRADVEEADALGATSADSDAEVELAGEPEALAKRDEEIHNANIQLQLQASQLAGHLQERKFDLQRRENEVNAQLASWDREHRDVELVFQQRAIELTEIKAELRQRCVELECQTTEIATAAVSAERERQHWHNELESRERLLDDREKDLQSLQNQLHRQQSALVGFQLQSQAERERSMDALRLKQQHWSAQQLAEAEQLERLDANVEQNRDQLVNEQAQHDARVKLAWDEFQEKCESETAARRQQLDDEETRVALLESIFVERTEELALEQTAFAAERQAWEVERQSQYKTLADRQRSGQEETEKRRCELDKRQRFLEKRTEALEVLQSDVSKLHKACLEMRLVTEQVWADMADRTDAGQMTHRIAQARRQWSEFVQDELQQVEDRKGEVAGLLTKLQEEHKRLGMEKGELRKWIDRRYREIEEQAARLITRQRELNEEALSIDQLKQEWQAREKQLRGQILDLQTQVNQRRAA
jgi:hypothetical protein